MRKIISINTGWDFAKDAAKFPSEVPAEFLAVDLPHTWNAEDGMDGGNDYYRGTCVYKKHIKKADLPKADKYFLEVCGANSSAVVFVDGKELAKHDGGYSTFRVDITDALGGESELAITVDNAPNDRVYPQMADFTFYGGLYRNVNIIAVNNTHFDLEYYGGTGLQITPIIDGDNANVKIQVYTTNLSNGDEILYTIKDANGEVVFKKQDAATEIDFVIEKVNKWHGRRNPYLYTAEVAIIRDGEVLDNLADRFGCRSFEIDSERGFILNGEEYPLRGVSRHQDRWG